MLGDRIRLLRTQTGKSQVQMAKDIGVTKQCISNWENNNILPSVDMLIKLTKYFSVSADYLLELNDKRYLDITGLSNEQIFHLKQIVNDILN